jgi:REP element-mobilizing transposase RayT
LPPPGEPNAVALRSRGYLPHLEAAEATYFVTFRLAGTLPKTVLRQAQEAKTRAALAGGGRPDIDARYAEKIDALLHDDRNHRWREDARVARIVADALRHFDGERYRLWAWCVMPNHVHVVLTMLPAGTPAVQGDLADIVQSWKSFTAHAANGILGRTGAFWHREYYDHLVRNDDDFARCLDYTIENPVKAGLCERWEEWPWTGLRLAPPR